MSERGGELWEGRGVGRGSEGGRGEDSRDRMSIWRTDVMASEVITNEGLDASLECRDWRMLNDVDDLTIEFRQTIGLNWESI